MMGDPVQSLSKTVHPEVAGPKLQQNLQALLERGVTKENLLVPRSRDFDLRTPEACRKAVDGRDVVIHLAAVTGGISFSRAHPASQYHESTLIDLNIVNESRKARVKKLVGLGSLFAYPSDAPMPLREETLFHGLPTSAHRGVGTLKRNLALLADLNFREYEFPMVIVYSANAYGPGDSTNGSRAHVIPSTIMKCLLEKELLVWGDGSPTRDFLYCSDVAEGLIQAAEKLAPPAYVNIGSGRQITVKQLVSAIVSATGLKGRVSYDISKAGGDARRVAETVKARRLLGFEPKVTLKRSLEKTVAWYRRVLGVLS